MNAKTATNTLIQIVATASLAAASMMLNGCIPLVVGGAAATASIATDRRTTGTQLDDELIEDKSAVKVNERFKDQAHVNITSYNGIVLLTGEVPDEAARSAVEQIVRSMPKVRTVQNELVIGPTTDFGARSTDSYVTSKVKARFVEASKFQINYVKVVTERNVVYLMGMVTHEEGDAAGEIARTTSGVQRVVKVFEYIN
jgi:osmotically-inducible protein OsmY